MLRPFMTLKIIYPFHYLVRDPVRYLVHSFRDLLSSNGPDTSRGICRRQYANRHYCPRYWIHCTHRSRGGSGDHKPADSSGCRPY